MIIIINTGWLDDEVELKVSASYISKMNPEHDILKLANLADAKSDKQTTLYIVAHGEVDSIAEYSPKKLAKLIGAYVNRIHIEHQINIEHIFFSSCNTGNISQGRAPFAEKFAKELSEILISTDIITVTAPNGILLYLTDGETLVVKDYSPMQADEEYLGFLRHIDNSSKEKALVLLQDHLEPTPFVEYSAMNINYLLTSNKELIVIEEENEEKEDHRESIFSPKIGRNSIFISSGTYNFLTERFAMKETSDTNEEANSRTNKRFNYYF